MIGGWTCSYRKIWEHPIFKGNALRVGVFQWMVHMAAIKPTRMNVGGEIVTLERGQLCASQAQICEATGISRKALRNLLDALEREHAVAQKRANARAKGRTIITICNYDKYQDVKDSGGQANGQERAKQGPIKEQGEQGNKGSDSNESGASAPPLRKQVFDKGKALLRGQDVKNPGALISKWIKASSEADVLGLILSAEDRAEPVSWIEGCLRNRRREGGRAEQWSIMDQMKLEGSAPLAEGETKDDIRAKRDRLFPRRGAA